MGVHFSTKIKIFLRDVLLFFLALILLWLGKISLWDIPRLKNHNPTTTAFIYYRGGKLTGEWTPFSQIPSSLKKAVVISEDGRFYDHYGLDWKEIKNSFLTNLKKKKFARGGSTITMQLAKNLYFSPRKSLWRKGGEIILALRLESCLSKDRILEIYLNIIEWGNGIYGITEASQHYFGKSPQALSVDDAAFLAALIPNPLRFGRHPPAPASENQAIPDYFFMEN